MGLFNEFPYIDLNNLNLDYTLRTLNALYKRGQELYAELEEWKQETDDEVTAWINETNAALEDWKVATSSDLSAQVTRELNSAKAELTATVSAGLLVIEGTAYGTRNGEAVEEGSPYYHNNCAWFQQQAAASAIESRAWANGENASPLFANNNSKYFRQRSEAWAVGQINGTDVPDTDDTYENNAKFYATQIRDSAAQIMTNTNDIADVKNALNIQQESIFNTPYVPSNMGTTNGVIRLYKGRVQYATGKIAEDSSGKYYRTQYGGITQNNLLLIGEHPLIITLGLNGVEWNCWSYSGTSEDDATHSNTGGKYINGTDPIYISAEYPDVRFGFSIRKVGASDDERTAFTDEELTTVRNAIKFWIVPDSSLSIIGALADAGSVGNAINKLRDNIGSGISLETIAYNNKTYADVFFGEYNVASPFYFDSGTISPAKVNAGSPVIIENSDYITGGHNILRCFGSSSSQIRIAAGADIIHFTENHAYFCALCVNVPRYSAGKAGMNILKTGVFDYALSKQGTTEGWEILSDIYTYGEDSAAVTCYLGTFNSANADVMIAMPVVIDLTALGIDTSTSDKISEAMELMKQLYSNYLVITDTPELHRRRAEAKNQKFAAATMDATSTTNRFLAVKELFDVARKKYVNPYYIPKLNESPELVKGTVCALPPDNAAFYEKYSFNKLYSVDDSIQTYPASTTKVLSIITAIPYITDIYDTYTLESDDIKASSGNTYNAGDILTIRDLLFSMLLESSNTSATALGTYCGRKILRDGTASHADAQAAFVAAMNDKASEIGCTASNFVNPSGMGRVAVSTCDDLLKILIDGSSYTEILRIWNKKTYTTTIGGSNSRTITITTSVANATLENDYYIFGGKTGALDDGPYTLIMIAETK